MSIREIIDQTVEPIFSTNSNVSAVSLFEARKKFENVNLVDIFISVKKPVLANLTGEQSFFGIIDIAGDYVYAKQEFLKKVGGTQTNPLVLQDFVVDAFNDLKNYLKLSVINQKLPISSVYSNISVKEAHTNFFGIYVNNQFAIYNSFKQKIDASVHLNSKIKTHIDFNKQYIKFLQENSNKVPMTFTETIKFYNLLKLSSGLLFSIGTDDAGDDLVKYQKYYIAQEIDCFHDACKRFGFKIDKRVPWILLADINSPAMKKYLDKYSLKNSSDLFFKRFGKAYLEDLTLLKESFFNFYKKFMVNNTSYSLDPAELCYNHARNPYYGLRSQTPEEVYFKDFDDRYWLRLYVHLKNIETGRGLNQADFENTVREAIDAYNAGKLNDALKFINGIFRGYGFINNIESLQQQGDVIDVEQQPVGSLPKPKIIF